MSRYTRTFLCHLIIGILVIVGFPFGAIAFGFHLRDVRRAKVAKWVTSLGYHDVTIVDSDLVHPLVGSGCIGRRRVYELTAKEANGREWELSVCCSIENAANCKVRESAAR